MQTKSILFKNPTPQKKAPKSSPVRLLESNVIFSGYPWRRDTRENIEDSDPAGEHISLSFLDYA